MASTVIDRNSFSQMQVGLAINPQYNSKLYAYNGKTVRVDYNFIMYTEMLVMNNTIKNTRYGIWNFPAFTMDKTDISTLDPDTYLQMGAVFRGNNISEQRRLEKGADTNDTVTNELVQRGGVSIVVGRDYWEMAHRISTRKWMNDTVVENNTLSDAENGYLDISFSQYNTIIRNNSYDGETGLDYSQVNIRHVPHNTGRKPNEPGYFG